ncbi:MAG: DUF5667 domain-containing protein [Patescibacteria group bacterium]|nr:DUF5667 domain-containing protein [Patescibacteria group bacterium]
MKKIIIFIIILAVLGSSGLGAVMVMAKTITAPPPEAVVSSLSGKAEIKLAGSENWIGLASGRKLSPGDAIRTGSDGQVAINFFDSSTSRVGPGSELVFDALVIDEYDHAKTRVSLSIKVGRVWSRILQLLDREAVFEISSSVTVATVRGTAFDFEVKADGLASVRTASGSVRVAAIKEEEITDPATSKIKKIKRVVEESVLHQGQEISIDQTLALEKPGKLKANSIPEDIITGDWFKNNEKEDQKFEVEIKEKKTEQMRQTAGILPGSKLYAIKRLAEKTKIAFTAGSEDRIALQAAFAGRRLAEAQSLAGAGDNLAAKRILNEYQEQLDAVSRLALDLNVEKEFTEKIDGFLNNQMNLSRRVTENAADAIIRPWLDGLNKDNQPAEEAFDEPASSKLDEDSLNNYGQEKLPERIESELPESSENKAPTPLPSAAVETVADDLSSKVQPAPESAEQNQLELLDVVVEQEEAPAPLPEKKLERLEIKADKYNMLTNSTKQFKAIAIYSDGSNRDVTNNVVWSLSGDIGEISSIGLLSSDVDGGKGVVSANYAEDGAAVRENSPEITALTIEF